jgi:5-methylcytosine-specific restriction protein B
MADIICRWRNGTPKTVAELVNSMPHEVMSSDRFRDIMSTQWDGDFFRTPYQLACQLGLYYESDDGYFHPRFDHNITTEEAEEYLYHWLPRYYIPNPYISKKGFNDIECPTFFLKTLYEYVKAHPNCNYHDACLACFKEEAKNNDDIIRNYINNYSRILTISSEAKLNITDIDPTPIIYRMDRSDKQSFFDNFNNDNINSLKPIAESLQQIYYGAPGTGKSFAINKVCTQFENYRTTFHPDTDYASFVGSYKPITIKTDVRDMAGHIVYEKGEAVKESRIVYRYVMQAFLKAYVAAWREQQNDDPKPVFLIVEEINRGNCAQIFGDIFQLLDRNAAGFSDYPIVADDDLAQELKEILGKFSIAKHDAINALYHGGKDVVGMVKNGECLLLPNNMYIWATMNTSDQSLFPIDSAFKRRWDWNYIKIKDAGENFKIVFSNGNAYDWWKFVSAINERIEGGEIQQEDKKLGYFFAKAKDKVVTPKVLLSKVLFYLYNDVFKDFGLDEDFFKDENGETMSFASYFDEAGNADEDRIERFVSNLGLEPESANHTDVGDELTVNGKKMRYITDAVFEILNEAAKSNTSEAIFDAVDEVFADRDDVVKSIDNPDSFEKENRWNKTPIIANDGIAFVVSNQWHKNEIQQVQELAEHFNITFDGDVDEYEDEDLSQKGKRLKYSVNGEGNYGIGEAFLKMSKVIAEQPDMTLQKMIEAAKIIRAKAVFLPLSSLSEWKERHVNDSKRDRRFFENDVLTTVGDNVQFIVSTQWGKQRLDKIQEFAATFGMKFEQLP